MDSNARGAHVYDKQLSWKEHGQKKLQMKAQELVLEQELECTFNPQINKGHRRAGSSESSGEAVHPVDAVTSAAVDPSVGSGSPTTAPTEAQLSSINLHLARQERARENAHAAQRKLGMASTASRKDFTKTTQPCPFGLSTSNRKQDRSASASPTIQSHRKPSSPTRSHRTQNQRRSVEDFVAAPGASSATADSASEERRAWDRERATLISIIEAQRQELEKREKAQQDAVKVAETFATAVQHFQERLVQVEQTQAAEVGELKRLLARQTTATEMIMRSLGVAPLPPPPPSSLSLAQTFPPPPPPMSEAATAAQLADGTLRSRKTQV